MAEKVLVVQGGKTDRWATGRPPIEKFSFIVSSPASFPSSAVVAAKVTVPRTPSVIDVRGKTVLAGLHRLVMAHLGGFPRPSFISIWESPPARIRSVYQDARGLFAQKKQVPPGKISRARMDVAGESRPSSHRA